MGIAVPRIKEFPADGRYWRVDWYGAVERDHNIPSEPQFQVIVSPLLTSDPFSSSPKDLASMKAVPQNKQRTIRIGTGQLPLIAIGSIWRNGACQSQQAGEIETLEKIPIDLLSTRPVLASRSEGSRRLIPDNYYNCGTAGASSKLMAIERDGDPFGILIPMLELVRFYYLGEVRCCGYCAGTCSGGVAAEVQGLGMGYWALLVKGALFLPAF